MRTTLFFALAPVLPLEQVCFEKRDSKEQGGWEVVGVGGWVGLEEGRDELGLFSVIARTLVTGQATQC